MDENAFTLVRPRGPDLDIPAAAPRKTNRSRAPIEGNVQQALDRNGRRTVSLSPRTAGAITIESREQSAASVAKRRKISKGGHQVMRRITLLIKRAIKWRSFGLALWVDAYENHTPRY